MPRVGYQLWLEVIIRVVLGTVFVVLDFSEPFQRKIQPEELWLYKNPRTKSYVPSFLLWPIAFLIPPFVILLVNLIRRYKTDMEQAILGVTLALALNGVITNIIKLTVGRPRPDYFWRCFPDGKMNVDLKCSGSRDDVIEGLKSFPSGHSSFSFASMGYVSLYLLGKFQVFTIHGRGQSWRLLIAFTPLMFALIIALSRTCDYHHHWQDVFVGSALGFLLAWLSYHQYYPSLSHPNCALPYTSLVTNADNGEVVDVEDRLIEGVKWI